MEHTVMLHQLCALPVLLVTFVHHQQIHLSRAELESTAKEMLQIVVTVT